MSVRLGNAACRLGVVSKQIINGVGRTGFTTTAGRSAAAAPTKAYAPVPKFLVEKMKHFQAPNDLPVHIKGGSVDKILYYVTGAVCTVGFIDCFHVYFSLAYA